MICEICREPAGEGNALCPACQHNNRPKLHKGFAAMSPDKQRSIAAKGGRAAHRKGTAHQWTPEEAARAGSKGGTISRGGRGRIDL